MDLTFDPEPGEPRLLDNPHRHMDGTGSCSGFFVDKASRDQHHDNGYSEDVAPDRMTSTPSRDGPKDAIIPEELSIDSVSEKECPTEFMVEEFTSLTDEPVRLNVPIIGFEIMEERAKFTVFKLHVQKNEKENWFVFRRYTDFIWLNDQLRVLFPVFRLNLPPKRWFGDNFDSRFLEERQRGLQAFVNNIIGHKMVSQSQPVRDFLCLDDPPGPHESLEESRALCECLEESMYKLRREIADKDSKIHELEDTVAMYKTRVESLEKVLKLERSFNPNSPQNLLPTTSHHSTVSSAKENVESKQEDESEEARILVLEEQLSEGELRSVTGMHSDRESYSLYPGNTTNSVNSVHERQNDSRKPRHRHRKITQRSTLRTPSDRR